jgi:hypothetical protein
MLDTTSYTDKLSSGLNEMLKSFTGSECIMVRKIKEKDSLKGKSGNCHINVKKYIDKNGGTSVSGWLLNRIPVMIQKGMYVWSFHSVWLKPDNKLVDVTDDQYYVGRDKTIFVPDITRVPDLVEGLSYNNFIVITDEQLASFYGNSIGKELKANTPYWCDSTMMTLFSLDEHSGVYRLLGDDYPNNEKQLADEYEIDFINGKPVPRSGSKYESTGFPKKMIFDYSISTR